MDYVAGLVKPFADALGLIFFSFFGGVVRTIYRPSSRKISSYIMSVIVSVPIGVLAGNFAIEYGLSISTSKAMAVVAGILAHDIIDTIFWAADKIRNERESLWSAVLRLFLGKFTKGDKDV